MRPIPVVLAQTTDRLDGAPLVGQGEDLGRDRRGGVGDPEVQGSGEQADLLLTLLHIGVGVVHLCIAARPP